MYRYIILELFTHIPQMIDVVITIIVIYMFVVVIHIIKNTNTFE